MHVIRHLHIFVVAAEEESFLRAAERLNIAAPAISRRMRDMEEALGLTLFERLPRCVRLTAAGRLLLTRARTILADFDAACAGAQVVNRGEGGTLRLGVNLPGLSNPVAQRAIERLRKDYPDVDLIVSPMASEAQMDALVERKIDAGILYSHYKTWDQLKRHNIQTVPFRLALNDQHPLAGKPEIFLRDLKNEAFCWPERASGRMMYDRMIAACAAGGLVPKISVQIADPYQTIRFAALGLSVGLIPNVFEPRLPDNVVLREVADLDLTVSMDICYRADDNNLLVSKLLSFAY